jgi:hypothetical protein
MKRSRYTEEQIIGILRARWSHLIPLTQLLASNASVAGRFFPLIEG